MTARESIEYLQQRMNEVTIGQERIVDRLIMGLLADGNMLIEGLPGLAKTRVVRSMSDFIESKFSRIQFTPDLRPSDVMGEERTYVENGDSVRRFHKGAIFGNIILADEINRAPAKVQSAMLEAMEEKQVTVSGVTYKLPELFIVMATQNPIEQEGTYPLSEAQKDRFLMHIKIDYVDMESEFKMVKMVKEEKRHEKSKHQRIPQELIFAARDEIAKVKISDEIGRYMIDLVYATRYPMRYRRQLAVMIERGVSPRGSLALSKCAQTLAWLEGKSEVDVKDVQSVIQDVFHHRLTLTEHALTNNRTNTDIIQIILENVSVPQSPRRS